MWQIIQSVSGRISVFAIGGKVLGSLNRGKKSKKRSKTVNAKSAEIFEISRTEFVCLRLIEQAIAIVGIYLQL